MCLLIWCVELYTRARGCSEILTTNTQRTWERCTNWALIQSAIDSVNIVKSRFVVRRAAGDAIEVSIRRSKGRSRCHWGEINWNNTTRYRLKTEAVSLHQKRFSGNNVSTIPYLKACSDRSKVLQQGNRRRKVGRSWVVGSKAVHSGHQRRTTRSVRIVATRWNKYLKVSVRLLDGIDKRD